MTAAPALEMVDISKSFPGVKALEGVSFDCAPREIHAICGENGAGKSTLIKILGGVYRPDEGSIRLDGAPVVFSHPAAARAAGISIIHQELSLLPDRSVAENIYLGLEPSRRGVLDRAAMRSGARALLARLDSKIDPDARAGDLSLAEQQLVEIAKALAVKAKILVMDEPTAALEDNDAKNLIGLVKRLKEDGVAVVYISHRMPEIAALADRVTVLKDGRKVATEPASAMPPDRVVRLMVGRELSDFFPPRRETRGPVLLSVRGGGNDVLADINLDVHEGEILGIAGLEGSGKSALARAIFGDAPFRTGTMTFEGRPLGLSSGREGIAAGIGYLPDDRKREGLLMQQSLRDNALLILRAFAAALGRPSAGPMTDREADARLAALDVRAARYDQEIRQLSGGNQQKVILARWLARDPKLVVVAEPTRGIDVAAKAAIYRILRDLADRGRGVVMISSDLPEVIGVSDRILVMHEGRIVGECAGGATEEEVMGVALGHSREARAS